MRLLVLGGTVFLGRFLVEEALSRGHRVTLFHRGRHNPGLFPDAETVLGDRDGGLEPLRGRRFDAVLDTSGYVPRVVGQSAALLAGAADHYTFVSTISVYRDDIRPGADEDAPLASVEDETTEEVMAAYGALKALCERVVAQSFPGRALVIRPGIIVGPYDYSDRFPYWSARIAAGGEVLAPGRPERRVQWIDARDLAAWTIREVEQAGTGTYNTVGPAGAATMGDMLEGIRRGVGGDARLTWADEAFLLGRGVAPFRDLPFWLPDEHNALMEVDGRRAVARGLTFRPVEDTARDVQAWNASRPAAENPWRAGEPELRAGLRPEREAELLGAWRDRA